MPAGSPARSSTSTAASWRAGIRPQRDPRPRAEAVEIVYDPLQITYRELLEFFQVHDPTILNRQGNDVGTSYRSAGFYQNEQQRDIANATIKDIETSGLWPGKVVTEVIPTGTFWEAEPEHQDYLIKHPNGYMCHYVRPQWQLPHQEHAS
jgi:peptide-methionine (S)-S-oxide reductase